MVTAAKTTTSLAATADPLAQAIAKFREGCSAYAKLPSPTNDEEHDRNIAATYGPPFDVLKGWNQPAVTREGAIEALRLALEEERQFANSEIAFNMLSSALAFFETERIEERVGNCIKDLKMVLAEMHAGAVVSASHGRSANGHDEFYLFHVQPSKESRRAR